MTKSVNCGGVIIGGGAPVSIQSMTNVDTRDTKALVNQISELADCGCEIIRCAIPDIAAAESFGIARKQVKIPLVADIHFDYRLAIAAMEEGADKIRINPGNIGSIENVRKVVEKARERSIPIRVGVNSGSLNKGLIAKYGGVTAAALAESGVNTLKIIEDMDYDQIVVSIKSSNVKMNYDAHMLLKKMTEYPIHIGITESGTPRSGKIKSAIGIGSLLLDGVGDTIRVSLTDNPIEEVLFARKILETVGLKQKFIDVVSCPTCGRTEIDLISLANEAEDRLEKLAYERQRQGLKPIKVAVMGCVVNGPGESREADYGIAGGRGEGLIFSHGKILEKVPEDKLIDRLIEIIEQDK
ncbi:MAG TPA: flavodoxin-dependent (E)-4-hydroxy-3-methylbut-2-enyl-diphosphate synthase [Mogibacterium sp.]|nr:flavodoxin-dependent (E)-4-hydroxy-3-methylbut-2-enyl-diphosphate synthase [Mogibacterium sp.]